MTRSVRIFCIEIQELHQMTVLTLLGQRRPLPKVIRCLRVYGVFQLISALPSSAVGLQIPLLYTVCYINSFLLPFLPCINSIESFRFQGMSEAT